jgi:hypothetical protein
MTACWRSSALSCGAGAVTAVFSCARGSVAKLADRTQHRAPIAEYDAGKTRVSFQTNPVPSRLLTETRRGQMTLSEMLMSLAGVLLTR